MTTESPPTVPETSLPDAVMKPRLAAFLKALADCQVVERAAAAAGLSKSGVYLRRRNDPAFAAAWDAAMAVLPVRVLDAIIEEALEGTPILNNAGEVVGRKRNARLLERMGEAQGIFPPTKTLVAVSRREEDEARARLDEARRRAGLLPLERRPSTQNLESRHQRLPTGFPGRVAPVPTGEAAHSLDADAVAVDRGDASDLGG